MKADVTLTKRPKSGESRSKVRYLDLSFEGWTGDGLTNGSVDNVRKPHGGYKGLMKHPMSIHSFHKGRDYQEQMQQVHQALEQGQQQSPTWAIQVHRMPTHSGESPLLSARLMSASKHEPINGRLRQEKESSSKDGRNSAPTSKKGASFYRPNRMHQYLTATELKDAAASDDVLKYGRPTRTTLLRARHRVSSATTSAYEARRQKEQRMMEIKKVTAFFSPEELIPQYSDAEEQSFYSFLLGVRYNSAHCLDTKSLSRHGVYMPRNNPLGCFVTGQRADVDTASAPAESPRSDMGHEPRPQTERQRRPTTAPSYGRKSSARAPRTPRTPRQAWGDVSVSLHVSNGTRQTLTLSRDGPCQMEAKLPVIHGTSLSKLQRFKEVPIPMDASEAPQPPPSPISARGEHSLDDVKPEPDAFPAEPPVQSPNPAEQEAAEENNIPTEEPGQKEDNETTTEEKAREENPVSLEEGVKEGEEEGVKEGEEEACAEQEGGMEGSPDVPDDVEEGPEEEKEVPQVDGVEDDKANSAEQNVDVSENEDNAPAEHNTETENTADDEPTAPIDITQHSSEGNGEPQTDGQNLHTPATSQPDNDEGQANDEDNVRFFVTEQGDSDVIDKTDDAGADVSSETKDGLGNVTSPDGNPQDSNKPQSEEDALSTTSSKKSHSKHVSFSIPSAEDPNSNVRFIPADDADIADDDAEGKDQAAQNKTSHGAESPDSDVDDLAQGQDHAQEPLKVIVTHIEKSLGAPAPKENEEEEEVIEEDP